MSVYKRVKMTRANRVDDGHIININSLSGHCCGKAHFYSATKHALTELTEGIRWELREINSHIKITSISPGLVKTNFAYTAVGEAAANQCYSTRQGLDPQDIANAIETVYSYPSHVQGANPPYRDLSLLPFPAYFPGPSKRLNRPQKEKSWQFPVKTKELNLMNIVVEI
ncbi:dehydrogenase/reductase SDR family member 11-like [Mytilus californianus]|uniref:dehydrogenase/reductase SDR family member 11-like n=1 Tax=Mytilus californianus TaxID=6549 RepID=UPI002247F6BF|nr:dehydrogenase/reductase SDR family member 11-like [Mytilus californianus]